MRRLGDDGGEHEHKADEDQAGDAAGPGLVSVGGPPAGASACIARQIRRSPTQQERVEIVSFDFRSLPPGGRVIRLSRRPSLPWIPAFIVQGTVPMRKVGIGVTRWHSR